MRIPLVVAALAGLVLPLPATEIAAQAPQLTVEIEEWLVPYAESRPRDPYVAPSGQVWFVGQRTHYVASFDPASGEFRKIDLEDGAGPHNLIIDDAGTIWYAGNRAAHIGRVDPATGDIKKYAMPEGVRDPHTLVWGPSGEMWFTAQGAGYIGRFDTSKGEARVVKAPDNSRPYGIVVDAQGRPWANLLGTNQLATVDLETFELTTIDLPRAEARTRRIELTSDGDVWYVDWAQGYLGRYSPGTGALKEWALPGGTGSRPYAMAVDSNDIVWVFETGASPNVLVGFDPRTESFVARGEVPSGAGTVRHMVYHNGELWFGTDTNYLGRAKLPNVVTRTF
jgi:virginiamycin B lyase